MARRGELLETLTIIVNGAPYGDERVWNAFRLALTSISAAIGMKVNVFLLGDAVNAAKKGQKTPQGYYNLEGMLEDLIKQGAAVAACGTCLNSRGITKEDLIKNIQVGSMMLLARWVRESSKVLTF
jgi:uncharacterized protein involved in oxidation of intracellular sulfur